MQEYSNNKIKNLLAGFILIVPIIALYFWVFIASMDVALDRGNYLNIMAYPFQGREEPLLHLISYLLNPIFYDPVYKLIFIQFFFITLLFLTIFKKCKTYNVSNFLKTTIITFLFLSIFSNMLGVQLRIGYATIIFLFITLFLKIKPSLLTLPIYLIPCFMHSGVIFAVVFSYVFQYFRIDNSFKFYFSSIVSVVVSTLFIKLLPLVFETLSISNYYLTYLDEDGEFGRGLPFSIIFFLLFSSFSIFIFGKRSVRDTSFWFGNFGLVLVYMGLFLDFYVAFKMLVPISAFLYIYVIDMFKFSYTSSILLLVFVLMLMPLSYLMLMSQVGLI